MLARSRKPELTPTFSNETPTGVVADPSSDSSVYRGKRGVETIQRRGH